MADETYPEPQTVPPPAPPEQGDPPVTHADEGHVIVGLIEGAEVRPGARTMRNTHSKTIE